MHNRWFWKTWHSEYKCHGYILLLFFVLSIILFSFYRFQGVNSAISWEKFQEQKVVETTLHEFQIGTFKVPVPVPVFLLFEYFQGSKLHVNLWISYTLLLTLILSFIYSISVFSTLNGLWYFVSTGMAIMFIVSLRLDILHVFTLPDRWFSTIVIGIYIGLSFYFNTFKKATPFQIRLLIFTIISLCLGSIIYFFSEISYPFLHLSVAAYIPSMFICIIFILTIAHEIPAAFLYLTTSTNSSKGVRHFVIIMFIYLVNLMLCYAHETKVIQWDVAYINSYLLLSISSIVGVWGWQHREALYHTIFPIYPLRAYLYFLFACTTFVTFSFLYANSHDAPLKALNDIIIFAHLGFGIIFLLYILSNFLGVADANLSAWKVLYKPNRMPYETFRLGGIIIVLAFIFYNNWKEYVYNSFSGFWNALGGLYIELGEHSLAHTYYEEGRSYGFANHHSNYAIAYQKAGNFQWQKSHEYYERATMKRPNVYAFANNANVYNWEDHTFDMISSLREGINQFPDCAELHTNLGFAYSKIHNLDSSLYFLHQARSHAQTKPTAETNFVAVVAQERIPVSYDSLLYFFDQENIGTLANAIGASLITGSDFKTEVSPFSSSPLLLHQATYLHNYIMAKARTLSREDFVVAEQIARDSLNSNYSESIKAALAHAHYLQGNVGAALQLMSELSYISAVNQGKYNYYIGLWLLEQGAETAADAFRYAHRYGYKNATFYLAIAETENRNIPEALILWDSLYATGTNEEKQLAFSIRSILNMSLQQAIDSRDVVKYQFCRYRLSTRDTAIFNVILNSFENVNYKAQTLIEMATRQADADRLLLANRYIDTASTISGVNPQVKELIFFTQLYIKATLGELDWLAEYVSDVSFPISRRLDKLYYEALLNEAGGDLKKADVAFNILANANPFYEEGIISSAQYKKQKTKDPMAAYTILAEAIQINKSSVRLWKAYLNEAVSLGFDEYAINAKLRLQDLLSK